MGRHPQQAFTLIELMVVVAVLAVLALIAAPSLKDYMLVQRLKGINAQLVTDLQFARSEAVSRSSKMWVNFGANETTTCYSLYTVVETPTNKYGSAVVCNCLAGTGSSCTGKTGATEVRTVEVPVSSGVRVSPALLGSYFAFDPVNGGIFFPPSDKRGAPPTKYEINSQIDARRAFRTTIELSGRPSTCGTSSSLGAPPC